jgi:hypothetical protein
VTFGHGALTDDAPGASTIRLTQTDALANVVAVLNLCAMGGLRCSTKTLRPSAATVSAVGRVLESGDFYPTEPIAAFAWPLLLQAGGLAELAGERLQLTSKGRAALGKPPAETIHTLWRSWVSKAPIDELSRIEHIKGQRTANTLTSVRTRRHTVATALSRQPTDEWIAVDDLFTGMRRARLSPTVARSDRALWRLYISHAEYGSLGYTGFADWPILEGRYTLAVLFEYAGTLGLFDLDYTDPAGARDDFRGNWGTDDLDYLSRYDGLRAVRLNALGSYVLGLSDSYVDPAAGSPSQPILKVLPNLDIVVTGHLSPADRLLLDAYATQTADRVWALRQAALLAAMDAGRDLDHLRQFLNDHTAHELPNPVTTLLTDVGKRLGSLRDLGVVRLVECADPALAALIANDRRLRAHCHLIGDRHLAITGDKETHFRKAVQALGYVLPSAAPV